MSSVRIYPVLAALTLGGCTIWTSETLEQVQKDNRAPNGVYYALPKGVVALTLSVVSDKAQFKLELAEPNYVPDPKHSFLLRYQPHPSYNDDVKVITTNDGLLSSVTSTTKDETAGILVNLASAIAAGAPRFESGEQGQAPPIDLLKLSFDPLDPHQRGHIVREIDSAIVAFRDKMRQTCGTFGGRGNKSSANQSKTYFERQLLDARASLPLLQEQKKKDDKGFETARDALSNSRTRIDRITCSTRDNGQKSYCESVAQQAKTNGEIAAIEADIQRYQASLGSIDEQQDAQKGHCRAYAKMDKPPRARIEVLDFGVNNEAAAHVAHVSHVAVKPGPPADCTIGVCYRPKEPYRIEYSLDDGKKTLVAELPNASDIVVIDIRRAFLVQKIQNITFEGGFLKQLHIDKGSELLAASKIPIDILDAIASKGLVARAKITTERKNIAEKQTALLNAQKELATAQGSAQGAAHGAMESGSRTAAPPRYESGGIVAARPASRGASSPAVVP